MIQTAFSFPTSLTTQLPFKSGLRLEALGPAFSLPAGQRLYRAGESARALYWVVEGAFKLLKFNEFGQERVVGLVGPGGVLGLGSLGTQAVYSEDAVALKPVRLLRIEPEHCTQPMLAPLIFSAMAQRSEELAEWLEWNNTPVAVRVSKALLWLAERFGVARPDGWYEVDLGLKQEELAALVGITRPTLTHSLTELRQRGSVVGTRGVYRVNPKKIKGQLEVLALAA